MMLIATLGCEFPESGETSSIRVQDEPICTSDEECTTGQICRKSYCVVEAHAPIEVGLTFIPPNSSTFLPQRIAPRLIDPSEELQIGLESSVAVRGKIVFAEAATLGPTGALVFRRPQAEDSFFTYQVPVTRGSFEVFILPGTYDLHFIPEDSSLPRKVWRQKTFTRDTLEELALPQPRELLTVTGSITHRHAAANGEGLDLPVADARVIAIASDTGNTSTIGVTDESGNYQIQVFPHSGTYSLHISPADDATLIPEVTVRDRFVAENDTPPPVSISLGTYLPMSFPLQVELASVSDLPPGLEDLEWSELTVLFRGTVGNGTVSRQAAVDERGRLNVNLLAGPYDIEIIAPVLSPVARTVLRQELSSVLDSLALPIAIKPRLTGHAVDAEDKPIANARLRFEALDRTTEGIDGRWGPETFVTRTTTDDEGAFEVWLERADYLVTTTPPAMSGLARQLHKVSSGDLESGYDIVLNHEPPTLLSGTLYGDDWNPLADVTVQGFTTFEGRQRVIGETQTNARGEFRLLLPTRLP